MPTLIPSMTCSPAWSTPRTDRPTDGALVAGIARALRRPLAPWQRLVADLSGERLPNGLPAYSRVVLIAPRRAGKSALMLARGIATIRDPRRRAFYTSAHATNAARMWRDDWFQLLDASPLRTHVHLVYGNGQEAIVMPPAGRGRSTFRLVAASGNAIRGAATNLVVIDEARELSPDKGDELEQAVFPTQATGAGGQTWIVSSAGDATSLWLARWRDLGRAAAEAGRTDRIAYVEYSAPLDADPDDEATWWLAHPGLGHHVNLDALRADHEVMTPDAFRCEYLGWWPETLVDTELVDAWQAGADDAAELVDPVVFAVEVDEDRQWCSIVAAAGDRSRVVVELVEHRPHGPWVAPRLVELAERWSPLGVVWDASGPAAALGFDLADVPTRLITARTAEVTAAAGGFHDAVVKAGRIAHRPDPELDAALGAARRRRAGGAWLYDRRQPGAGPLIAATLATWALREASGRIPSVT